MCAYWFNRCIEASVADAAAQRACVFERDANCGSLQLYPVSGDASPPLLPASSMSSQDSISNVPLQTSTPKATAPPVYVRPLALVSSSRAQTTSTGLPRLTEGPYVFLPGPKTILPGAIAAGVVGVLAGIGVVAVLLYVIRRRKNQKKIVVEAATYRDEGYDEKQVATTSIGEHLRKPELHGESKGATELLAAPYQDRTELSASIAHELDVIGHKRLSKTRTSIFREEIDTIITPVAPVPALPRREQPKSHSDKSLIHPPLGKQGSSSSEIPKYLVDKERPLSQKIVALEPDKERVDAHLEDPQGLEELRDQKIGIQQKATKE